MREFSVPAVVEIEDSANLTDTLFTRGDEQPDRVVLRRKEGASWHDVTADKFRDEVVELAKGIVAAGIKPGDRVALMSRTRYEWTLIDYAIWAAGGVTVPIYETSSAEQVEWVIGDSGAKAAFVETEQHEDTVESVRGKLDDLREVWRIDCGALDRLIVRGEDTGDDVIAERRAARGAADLATIIYTSGTTGRPKGCEISHGNLVATARNVTQSPLSGLFEFADGSTLLFLPLAHSFARIIEVAVIEAGVILGHTADIQHVAPELESYRPTFLLAVPRVFEKVYNRAEQKATAEGKGKIFHAAAETAIAHSQALDSGSPGLWLKIRHGLFDRLVYRKLRAALGGRVSYAVSGGAALGERLGHFFRGIGVTVLEGYGLTETTAPATVNVPTANKVGSVGRPLPGVTVAIAGDGEVLVKGVNVFQGYWHNEGASKEVIQDGWFRTGDLGELDEDGYLKITGRKKEIIVTAGGKNVAPAPLEDRLRAHPLVSQCMVIGDGKPFIGCIITLDLEALEPWKELHGKAAQTTVEQLRADPDLIKEIESAVEEANKSVSKAESIKKYRILDIDFTEDTGHLTPTLKVKRGVVARDFATEIESLYS